MADKAPSRGSGFFSIGIFLQVFSIALLIGLLGFSHLLDGMMALRITGGLLALNLLVVLVNLFWRKEILLTLNLVQLALFSVIFWQIHQTLGLNHFTFREAPVWWHWVEFTLAHVLRAVDLLDFLEEYHINLQNLRHNSNLVGVSLVILHVGVDIFLIAFTVKWIKRWWKKRQSLKENELRNASNGKELLRKRQEAAEARERVLKIVQLLCLAGCIGLMVVVARQQHWGVLDCFLWPLDQAVRTLDIGDAMQIFHWRLHSVEMGFWTIALALSFRLFVGIYLFRWLNYLTLVYLRGFGKTIDDYIQSLDDPNPEVRKAAVAVLGQLGPNAVIAIPGLLKLLADEDAEIRKLTQGALVRMGLVAVPQLTEVMSDQNSKIRSSVTEVLGTIGPNATPAIPGLIAALDDRETELFKAIGNALLRIGAKPELVIPRLIQALITWNTEVRQIAETTLGRLDSRWPQSPQAQQSIPKLFEALGSGNVWAFSALELIDSHWRDSTLTRDVIRKLIETLLNNRSIDRASAARCLGLIGRPSLEAIPGLVESLADEDVWIRGAAIEALPKIDPRWMTSPNVQQAVPKLIAALSGYASDRTELAAKTLGDIGASSAISALINALTKRGDYFRTVKAAAQALAKIRPLATEAIPHLEALLKHEDSDLRRVARTALDTIAPNRKT